MSADSLLRLLQRPPTICRKVEVSFNVQDVLPLLIPEIEQTDILDCTKNDKEASLVFYVPLDFEAEDIERLFPIELNQIRFIRG